VSYEQLLDVFWKAHDPTQVNRQGPDFGTQYRTAIFTHSPEQEAMAKKSRAALEASGKLSDPSQRKSRRQAPFIAQKNITRNIYRNAAQRAATSELEFNLGNARNRARLLGFFLCGD